MVNYSIISSLLVLEVWDHWLLPLQILWFSTSSVKFTQPSSSSRELPSEWSLTLYNVLIHFLFSYLAPNATYIHIVDITAVASFMK